MVNMRCEMCGSVWTKDDSYRGTEIRCANCQGVCKCIPEEQRESESYECAECGLACPKGVAKCPACGGEIVMSARPDEESAGQASENGGDAPFWENFFWGFIFPEPTLLLGVASLFNKNIRINRLVSVGFICGALIRFLGIVILVLIVAGASF